MKILIETKDRKATVEIPDYSDVYETLEACMGAMQGIGFQPQSINDALDEVERIWIGE